MNKSQRNVSFWNHYARLYDFEITKFSGHAYNQMYQNMKNVLSKGMRVLEIATGTGLVAINVAHHVHSIEATDVSPKMIETAKRKILPDNIYFSIQDATTLAFNDNTFDAVIVSNALHIMPDPTKVLQSISRVLKPNGLLIAPNYTHGHIRESSWKSTVRFLRLVGLDSYTRWTPDTYIEFIAQNGFLVNKREILSAAFPMVYLEAYKKDRSDTKLTSTAQVNKGKK